MYIHDSETRQWDGHEQTSQINVLNATSVRTMQFVLTKMIKNRTEYKNLFCVFKCNMSIHNFFSKYSWSFSEFFFVVFLLEYSFIQGFLLFIYSCSEAWTDPEIARIQYGLKLVILLFKSLLPDYKAVIS